MYMQISIIRITLYYITENDLPYLQSSYTVATDLMIASNNAMLLPMIGNLYTLVIVQN